MARREPIQTDFSVGQLSHNIEQRSDLAEVNAGLKECSNFIPLAQGSVEKRHGRSVIHAIDNVSKGKIIPFHVDDNTSYSIVITNDGKIRLANRRGLYMNPATPEINILAHYPRVGIETRVKQYIRQGSAETEIVDDPLNRYISISGKFFDEQKRTMGGISAGGQEWSAVKIAIPAGKEHQDYNIVINSRAIRYSSYTGDSTGDVVVMTDPDVDSTIISKYRITFGNKLSFKMNPKGKSLLWVRFKIPPMEGVEDLLKATLTQFSVIDAANPGGIMEVAHNFDSKINFAEIQYDISPDSVFIYLTHRSAEPSRIVYDRVTKVFSYEQLVTAGIITHPPTDWAPNNYPGCVVFFEGRLWFAGTYQDPAQFYASRTAHYNDFNNGDLDARADDPLLFKLSRYGDVRWLAATNFLLAGTDVGEFTFKTEGGFIAAGDIRAVQQSAYGCARIQPVVVGNRVVYVTSDRLKLRDLTYTEEEDSWLSKDLTFTSDDITQEGIEEITFLQNPHHLIKCRLKDGTIAVCSYQKHLDIIGWFKEDSTSEVISLGHIVNDGSAETILLVKDIVRELTIQFEDHSELNFLDSRITNSHFPMDTAIDAPHLKNKLVQIISDGARQVDVLLDADGRGHIQFPASEINVGYSYPARLVTRDVNDMNRYGESSAGQMKRWNKIFVRLFQSIIPIINGDRPSERTPQTPMNDVEGIVTGDVQVIDLGYDKLGNITIEQDLPFGCVITGIFGELGEENL